MKIQVEIKDLERFNPRRPYNDKRPEGYLESDLDFVLNNLDLCIELLEDLDRTYKELGFRKTKKGGESDENR